MKMETSAINKAAQEEIFNRLAENHMGIADNEKTTAFIIRMPQYVASGLFRK